MALPTLAEVRAAVNTRLATISGLQTYAYMPAGNMAIPCAFVANGDGTDVYHESMQAGIVIWPLKVWVLVSLAPPAEEAQADLDVFLSPTGASSVKAVLEGSGPPQTLGAVVSDVSVDGFGEPRVLVTEQGSYWGADFQVRVYTTT